MGRLRDQFWDQLSFVYVISDIGNGLGSKCVKIYIPNYNGNRIVRCKLNFYKMEIGVNKLTRLGSKVANEF